MESEDTKKVHKKATRLRRVHCYSQSKSREASKFIKSLMWARNYPSRPNQEAIIPPATFQFGIYIIQKWLAASKDVHQPLFLRGTYEVIAEKYAFYSDFKGHYTKFDCESNIDEREDAPSRQAIQKHLHTLRDYQFIKFEKGNQKYRNGKVMWGLDIYFEFQFRK
ncbi:hypothetical protein GCM10011369_05930 [Neiella marina]|uniref:Uncharacterized protein n=1 Tax=Neiella marina TaxID=508461 RepID=A0A8J2U2R5_9GAMM|nr:hypothetical protein [Neiella marina]GGA67115.1 hypothetical protein GCM10011369_05930 [Neiella marina]